MIQCAIGGSAINNWIPEQVLRSNQFTSDWFTSDWLKNNKISLAHRKRGKEVFKNILPVGGEYIIDNMKYHFLCEPSFLFEASFAKIRNINLKGVLWYQGEADSESDEAIVVYSDFYKMLVDSWRRNFNDSKLLFVSIQLPSYKAEKWPEMRYAQYMSIKSNKYCYIVPTIDLGDYKNIHYNGKKEVGKRAAFVALDNVYGKEVCSIPEYNDYKITDNALTISFKDIGNGLNVSKGKNQVPIILHYNDGINEIVNATLNANSELIVPINREVQSLYYAWKPYLMETPLLLSKDGIPVLPFKIDF